MTSALAGPVMAAVSVGLTVLVAVAAQADPVLLAAAVSLAVVCLALGWAELLGLDQARRSTAGVVALSGLAAVGLARYGTSTSPLAQFAVLLAGCVLLAFAHQMSRRDGRTQLVESLTATLSGQVIAVLAAGWLLLAGTRMGSDAFVVAACAVAAATVGVLLPVRRGLRGWAGFGAGLILSLLAILLLGQDGAGSLPARLLVGVAVSAVAAGTALLLTSQQAARAPLGMLAAGAAPVCAVGTLAYAMARLAGS